MKLLVVDDEQDICDILKYRLEMEGYEVDTVGSAEEALQLRLCDYALLLLDVMMGGMSGFELARVLKTNPETATLPIIFITALDSEDYLVKGLNLGGDDYITKPISLKVLTARIKVALRRYEKASASSSTPEVITYKSLIIQMASKTVTLNGERVPMTRIEFELLCVLVGHPGKVWSRNELLQHCWPNDVCVLNRTVDVNITRLRKKIGDYGKQITTRIGYGYTFEV